MSPRNRPRRPKSPLGFMPVLKCTFFLGRPVQLAHFRGALVEHIGRSRPLLESLGLDGALFHGRDDNHPDWVDAGGRAIDHQKKVPVLNWPPVVYYRTDGQHPVVVGVGPGARALQLLLLSFARELQVEGRNVSILGWNGERFNCPMGPADDAEYLLEEYAFLKEAKDLEAYEAEDRSGQRRRLEGKLVNHIVDLYASLGEDPGPGVSVTLLETVREGKRPGVDGPNERKVHTVRIRSNVHLPVEAGLGVGTRNGYGRILLG